MTRYYVEGWKNGQCVGAAYRSTAKAAVNYAQNLGADTGALVSVYGKGTVLVAQLTEGFIWHRIRDERIERVVGTGF